MSAANLQGVLASTLDADIWIDRRLAATMRSSNKVYLLDGTPVDFIYDISGLRSFASELRDAKRLPFHGLIVPVLPLERICRSKAVAGRDKDKLHIVLIRQTICAQRARDRKERPPGKRLKKRAGKRIA